MNEALTSLEAEHGVIEEQEVIIEEPAEVVAEVEATQAEKPPGFISYEDWIAKGKDTAAFRGENDYKKQNEALKKVRDLTDTMRKVVIT